ncbi:MAG: Lycopene cyclase [Anaerolineae bacterium]|nr:Lycopene cyclase [Anaerolineae bacterium]
MKHYDFIIAGGGAAGLSLAFRLINSSLRDRTILIIDRDDKRRNDRTWCFWTTRPTPYDAILHRSWQKITIRSDGFSLNLETTPYRYNMLRGIDFYEFTRQTLSGHTSVDFLNANILQVLNAPDRPAVTTDQGSFSADWVFDSVIRSGDLETQPDRYHYLKQHFVGWEIETEQDCFDPSSPVLFDFRTPQDTGLRFMYILPSSSRTALVEYTIFSADLLDKSTYEERLRDYLSNQLGLRSYQIHSVEQGVIPMTDQILPRRLGERILATGTRGGLVKPSSGYAFLRIQHDTAAIVKSIEKNGHPFVIPTSPDRYRLFDSILLQILYRQGEKGKPIFEAMFRNNPVQRIFSFLDETGNLAQNLQVITSLPPLPFIKALYRIKVLRQI